MRCAEYITKKAEDDNKDSAIPTSVLMRDAMGAAVGGGLGFLLSRILHSKPKAWRTALYTLGGAAAGGLGTHWYLKSSGTAEQLRQAEKLNTPEVRELQKELDKLTKERKSLESTRPLNTAGWSTLAGASGYGVGGLAWQQARNWLVKRDIKTLTDAIKSLNVQDQAGKIPDYIINNILNKRTTSRGRPIFIFEPDNTKGPRFSLNQDAVDEIAEGTINPDGSRKQFSRWAGALTSIPSAILAGTINWVRGSRAIEDLKGKELELQDKIKGIK